MQETSSLRDQVLSEIELLEKLNVEQGTLDRLLREKGFTFVRLNAKCRVYLVNDVLGWFQQRRRNAQ